MGVPLGHCTACGRSHHPPTRRCPHCSGSITDRAHPGAGIVVSWTRVERPPEGFPSPQRILLVRLDETEDITSSPLVLATTHDDALLESGTRVRLRPEPDGRLVADPDAPA